MAAAARPNVTLNGFFNTNVIHAAGKKDLEALEAYLKEGQKPDEPNVDGWTALHICCMLKFYQGARMLLEHKADVHAAGTKSKNPPIQIAAQMGDPKTILVLLSYGADPHMTNGLGMTAISKAANEPTKILLTAGTGSWSPAIHQQFPNAFRAEVKAILHLREAHGEHAQAGGWASLPLELIYIVADFLIRERIRDHFKDIDL